MKKINLFNVFFIAALSAFISCSGSNSKNKSSARLSNETSVSADNAVSEQPQTDELKITVSLPEGWEKVGNSVLEHQYMKGSSSFMIKHETVLDGKSLNDAVTEAKAQIGKYFEGAEFSETKDLKIDGNDAKSFVFTYGVKAAGMTFRMKMLSTYTMINGKCQTISIGGQESDYSSLVSDISILLKGIKFFK